MAYNMFLIIITILTCYAAIQVFYLLIFSLAGHIGSRKKFTKADTFHKIRIFIPGYKEDKVIIDTAQNALLQDYPKEKYEMVVIADQFSDSTLATLKSLPIKVIEVHFEKSTKGKALHNALELTQNAPVDLVLILDADNHMEPGFLKELNNAYASGYKVVQGHRIAKNINTPFALLDACTEEINNHIFRRGHVALGLPSALIGSGMAFDWKLFNEIMQNIGDTSGEDKELEFRIVRKRIPIAFLDDSHVLDEKVAQSDVFSKQRSRWLATQVEFFQKYFLESWVQLFKGNVAFFNKVFQTYLLPRVLLVVAVLALIFISFFISKNLLLINLVLCFLLMFSLLIGIPRNWYNRNLLQAFLEIPGAILGILKSLTQRGKARKQFIHTPHGDSNQNHS